MRRALLPLVIACLVVACEDPASPSGTCLGPQVFTADTTVSGIAFTDDCTGPSGTSGDVYAFTIDSQKNILFTMRPVGYAGQLALFTGTLTDVATPHLILKEYGRGSITVKAFLPAGTYFVVAGSDEASGGDYTLSSAPTTTTPCTIETTNSYTVRGADIAGALTTDDCQGGLDFFRILMEADEQLAVSVEMSRQGVVLWRRDGSASAPDVARFDVPTGNVTTGAAFTAPARGAFNVVVGSNPAVVGGAVFYTLHIR